MQKTLLTIEQAMGLCEPGEFWELDEGELIKMTPAGGLHGEIGFNIAYLVAAYVRPRKLGVVFNSDTGFILRRGPDTLRAPDVAFISKNRLPPGRRSVGYMDIAPDLVVEVVSPSDSASYVQRKVETWLRAGAHLVWVVYPESESIVVYRSLQDVRVLSRGDTLDGSPVLEGFSLKVSDVFETLA